MDEREGEIETVVNGGCAGELVGWLWGEGGLPFCSTSVGGDDDGVFVVEVIADVIQH